MPFLTKTVLLLSLLATSTSSVSGEAPIQFLDQVGEFTVSGHQDYESTYPGLGYSTHYHAKNTTASIYIYDRGLDEISEDPSSELYVKELDIALREVHVVAEKEGYEQLQIQRRGDLANLGSHKCRSLLLSYVYKGVAKVSWTCVLNYSGKILKIRYTFVPQSNSNQRTRLSEFVRSLSSFLWPSELPRSGT